MNISFNKVIASVFLILFVTSFYAQNSYIEKDVIFEQKIKPFNAFIKSAVIPGWGEISMNSSSGYMFILTELLLWSGRYYYSQEIDLYERDAYLYALKNAGLKHGDYDDAFLYKLSRYNSSGFEAGGYNEAVYQTAQNLFTDNEIARNQYIFENAILDDNLQWSWGDREQRRQYSIKRKNADHSRDYVKLVTGIIVANHVISSINSLRIANRINRNVEFSLNISEPNQPIVTLQYNF